MYPHKMVITVLFMYGTLVQVHANSFQGGNVKKTPWLSQTKNLNSTLLVSRFCSCEYSTNSSKDLDRISSRPGPVLWLMRTKAGGSGSSSR